MFKKDNFLFGAILGTIVPIGGLILFKVYKFAGFSFSESFSYMLREQGYRTLSAALSISLLLNAVLFTIYINTKRDHTAKGIFVTTLIYGLIILLIKTFY
ncbi:MAG: hypothetical protein KF829_05935 [Ferruginibacter sp.]|nr:hypothetical protein [Ferruginibacter sp.]